MLEFPQLLMGSVWHTTHPDRYNSILATGAILPEPNINDTDRWCDPSSGKDGYPYVRSIGGISLFDFRFFNPETYCEDFPSSSIDYFVPCRCDWMKAVWIKIDYERLGTSFVSGEEIYLKYHLDKLYNGIMPKIEGACIGTIELALFKKVFMYSYEFPQFKELAI